MKNLIKLVLSALFVAISITSCTEPEPDDRCHCYVANTSSHKVELKFSADNMTHELRNTTFELTAGQRFLTYLVATGYSFESIWYDTVLSFDDKVQITLTRELPFLERDVRDNWQWAIDRDSHKYTYTFTDADYEAALAAQE